MKFEVPSKICLSLKEINYTKIDEIKQITNAIEIRLDYIYLDINKLKLLNNNFDLIILKSPDFTIYNQFIKPIKNENINNVFFDIDGNFILNNKEAIDFPISLELNLIISFHNMKLSDINDKFINILSNINKDNIFIYKIIIDEYLIINEDLLSNLYNKLKIKLNKNIILFCEGKNYTETRYLNLKMGAPFTYCALSESTRTGKGQPTYMEFWNYFGKKTI
ncbi:MAG: hypothetical protein A2X64_10630 [Ignavibacteria bacterium GWF2_33_9]|nr:MAG: hypothetical protein A2X64_10630 [Ignavibacteria bacterium GWF2_33_9]